MENSDGVHLMASNGYSLCGDSFDGDCDGEEDFEEMRPTRKRTVTCEVCISIIMLCRGVRVKTQE